MTKFAQTKKNIFSRRLAQAVLYSAPDAKILMDNPVDQHIICYKKKADKDVFHDMWVMKEQKITDLISNAYIGCKYFPGLWELCFYCLS